MTSRADVKNVFHNGETGQFEADVTLYIDGAAKTFSVSVLAPITAEFDAIRPALIRAAENQSSQQNPLFSSRSVKHPMRDRTEEMLDRILFAEPSYLDAILARAA